MNGFAAVDKKMGRVSRHRVSRNEDSTQCIDERRYSRESIVCYVIYPSIYSGMHSNLHCGTSRQYHSIIVSLIIHIVKFVTHGVIVYSSSLSSPSSTLRSHLALASTASFLTSLFGSSKQPARPCNTSFFNVSNGFGVL